MQPTYSCTLGPSNFCDIQSSLSYRISKGIVNNLGVFLFSNAFLAEILHKDYRKSPIWGIVILLISGYSAGSFLLVP